MSNSIHSNSLLGQCYFYNFKKTDIPTFSYFSLFEQADMWIGCDAIKSSPKLTLEGSADMFVSIPRPNRVTTDH